MSVLNRAILQNLALTRLDDARSLLAAERWSAAYYLAGYAVECALKACIARRTQQHEFPDKERVNRSWVHDLEKLVGVADLPLEEKLKSDARFAQFWNSVKDWSEHERYEFRDVKSAVDLHRAIGDPDHGVLRWLREYW